MTKRKLKKPIRQLIFMAKLALLSYLFLKIIQWLLIALTNNHFRILSGY